MPAKDLDSAVDSPPAGRRPSAVRTLVKAAAFVSVVVALEVVAANLFIPSAAETQAIAARLADAAAESQDVAAAQDPAGEDPVGDQLAGETLAAVREVSLGSFNILRYDPHADASLNIDFELYGAVLAEDEAEFLQLYGLNQRRIDEQITITMRSVEVTDLTDPGLGLIKRKILEKTNRALGKPLVREAIFSKFTFYER
jgi:flagellar FliL protein